jgi:hypothetical protein
MALVAALFFVAVVAGVGAAHYFGRGYVGISQEQAIAVAQTEIHHFDPDAELIAARADRFSKFWNPGETDFAAPAEQRVWAVAFRGTFPAHCNPVSPDEQQQRQQCPPPNTTMMIIVNYRDGEFVEGASPISGFGDSFGRSRGDVGKGVIPGDTDFCRLDAYGQSGYLVSVRDPADGSGNRRLRPFLLAPAPAELARLRLDRLWVARSDDPADLPTGSSRVPLDLLAHDPSLHSCDYHLADKPLTRSLHDAALQFLADRRIATREELDQTSVVWMISDSDLPNGALAVYTLLQWPGHPRTVMMTVFDRNAKPLGAVPVDLCAADEE